MRLVSLLILLAAREQAAPLDDEASTARLADGTPEAGNLIAHRDGGDRLYGTSDDDLFDDLAEVDSVRWVGPATMERLAWFATAHGWTPEGDDVLGIWDGVQFTVIEAEATVAFANTADADFLDHDLGLDGRAVDAIVAARPIPSVQVLSELYYVGTSALVALEAEAVPPTAVSEQVFADDLCDALVDYYADYGDEIAAMGGSSLAEAQALVSADYVWEAEEDPYAHDPADVLVYAHPDRAFPGSDTLWFGAYERSTGDLIEVYALP